MSMVQIDYTTINSAIEEMLFDQKSLEDVPLAILLGDLKRKEEVEKFKGEFSLSLIR